MKTKEQIMIIQFFQMTFNYWKRYEEYVGVTHVHCISPFSILFRSSSLLGLWSCESGIDTKHRNEDVLLNHSRVNTKPENIGMNEFTNLR
jgi:hypothetical protein